MTCDATLHIFHLPNARATDTRYIVIYARACQSSLAEARVNRDRRLSISSLSRRRRLPFPVATYTPPNRSRRSSHPQSLIYEATLLREFPADGELPPRRETKISGSLCVVLSIAGGVYARAIAKQLPAKTDDGDSIEYSRSVLRAFYARYLIVTTRHSVFLKLARRSIGGIPGCIRHSRRCVISLRLFDLPPNLPRVLVRAARGCRRRRRCCEFGREGPVERSRGQAIPPHCSRNTRLSLSHYPTPLETRAYTCVKGRAVSPRSG